MTLGEKLKGKSVVIDWLDAADWTNYHVEDFVEDWLLLSGMPQGEGEFIGLPFWVRITEIHSIEVRP